MAQPPANAPLSYVRYTDDVEQTQPDEEKLTDETVESMSRLARFMFEKYRHAVRDAHAKSHGVLRGELHVLPGLPEHLAQGVFREAKVYPVMARLSSAPGAIGTDKQSTLKGFALKLLGVEGKKFLVNEADEVTQDFLLVTDPVIATGDIKSYHDMQLKLEQLAYSPEGFQHMMSVVARGANKVANALGFDPKLDPTGAGHPHFHILGETFHSMGAFRFGDHVAKISAAPLSPAVKALEGKEVDVKDDGTWRDLVQAFFAEQGAEYELRAQLCTDLKTMPVEDGSVEWPAEQSPYQPIARLVFPQQATFSPARRVFADDQLSFNPFHCLPEHRPLGSINRVRIKAYENSSRYRHEQNAQPRTEPRSIDQLPD